MTELGSTTDVIGAVAAAVAAVLALGVALPAIVRWLRRRAKPRSPDEVASEQRAASEQFGETLLAITELTKQFRPWPKSAFDEDMKTLRASNTDLVKVGKQRVRAAFGDQSAVARAEQAIRYAVARTIELFQSHQLDPPPEEERSSVQWEMVSQPFLVLEHAHTLFMDNARAAQRRPLDVQTELKDPYGFWNELQAFAAPARRRSPWQTT